MSTKPDPCGWCALQPGVYLDDDHGRICRRCYAYRAKYHILPPPRVISKRIAKTIHGGNA